MKNTIFTGCGVATVTPMRPDGTVDLKKYADFIDKLIQNGVDAIIVNGTTGESATLSEEEQYNIICCAKDVIKHRVPLIAGAGSNNTHHAAKLALNARNAGADAVLSVTPYYNKANENGLVEHYNFITNGASFRPLFITFLQEQVLTLSPKHISNFPKIRLSALLKKLPEMLQKRNALYLFAAIK